MRNAIQAAGFRMVDQSIYKDFQTAAGLTADGFPGATTMTALANALSSYGASYPFTDGFTGQPVVAYPWSSTGTYGDGGHPTVAEWCAGSPAGSCP